MEHTSRFASGCTPCRLGNVLTFVIFLEFGLHHSHYKKCWHMTTANKSKPSHLSLRFNGVITLELGAGAGHSAHGLPLTFRTSGIKIISSDSTPCDLRHFISVLNGLPQPNIISASALLSSLRNVLTSIG